MSEKFGQPEDIKKSIKTGNTEHLRAAGRKGAEVANRNRDIRNTLEDTGWTPDNEPFESGDHYIIGGRH